MYQSSPKSCSGCVKLEDRGAAKFSFCSNCKIFYYCSKECQIKDWSHHKKICAQKNKRTWTAVEKLQDFEIRFHPLMSMMTMCALLPYPDIEDRRSGWLGESHVLMVELMDTPPNSPSALQIKSYIRSKISDLPEHYRAFVRDYKIDKDGKLGPNAAIFFAFCNYGELKLKPLCFADIELFSHRPNNLATKQPKKIRARIAQTNTAKYKEQINSMATGEAKSTNEAVQKARTA